ncbi:chitin deacetylase [Mortierella alpina]|nr:chitin deacetylase [Mortierella alpina]
MVFPRADLVVVKAQKGIVASDYPTQNEIPPTNSSQVQAWLKELGDLSGAPKTPPHTAAHGGAVDCKGTFAPDECNWTCQQCNGEDLQACPIANTWGLTFDDGPTPASPTLLDYLKTQNLSATFFLIGSNVVANPAIAKRELQEGHHLASHTWSHHSLVTLTNEQIVAEIRWTEKAIFEATGVRPKYLRPPYGDMNNRVRFLLKKMGYTVVDWTGDQFDTNDWKLQEKTDTEANLFTTFSKSLDAYAKNTTQGFYCLEHDLAPETVALAQKLIPLGKTKNIKFASVAQCVGDKQPYQGQSNATTSTSPKGPALPSNKSEEKPKSGSAETTYRNSGLLLTMVIFVGSMLV